MFILKGFGPCKLWTRGACSAPCGLKNVGDNYGPLHCVGRRWTSVGKWSDIDKYQERVASRPDLFVS